MSQYLWGQPLAFLLFIPWLILVGFLFFKKKSNQAFLRMSTVKRFQTKIASPRIKLYKLNQILFVRSLVVFFLAFGRPQQADLKL